MAELGKNSVVSWGSYVGVGRETTLGTYATMTTGLDFLTSSLNTKRDGKILDEIVRNADGVGVNRITLGKGIEGALEFYYRPSDKACNYILQQAFGGTISSATLTTGAYQHTFNLGDMENNRPTTTASNYKGLSVNIRKGNAADGKVWQYQGLRVNELVMASALDEALRINASFIGMDSTQVSNDVSSGLTYTDEPPFVFTQARISVESSLAACTTSTYWHVQSAEISIKNSLKADADSRRLGSEILDVMPIGKREIGVKLGMRFDTVTAYDYFKNATRLAMQLEFIGATIGATNQLKKLTLNIPKLYLNNSTDPEIGGPDEVLKSSLEFQVLYDSDSTTGYALKALLQNDNANYQ
jgi:hypothetical protein